jgi:hypothetical protein
LGASKQDEASPINDRNVNSPIVVADVGEKSIQPVRKSIKIQVLSRKSREAKAQHPKPPSIIKAGPVVAPRKTIQRSTDRLEKEELKRRNQLDEDEACQLIINAAHFVRCRPCEAFIGLERKMSHSRGYYKSAWQDHIKNTDGHQRREREWKARGDNIPKDQDIQWEAVWTDVGKRFRDGTPKMEPSFRQVVSIEFDLYNTQYSHTCRLGALTLKL